MGKMAGAVGNYNAHISAYPEVCTCYGAARRQLCCNHVAVCISVASYAPNLSCGMIMPHWAPVGVR